MNSLSSFIVSFIRFNPVAWYVSDEALFAFWINRLF